MTDMSHTEQLALRRRLARLARFMDSAIRIPIIGKRIGWDALLGLVPGVGDFAGAAISGYILLTAWQLGVPGRGLGRMVANIGFDTLLGTVPVLGDFFDMAYKANERNVAIIEKYVGADDLLESGNER